MKKFKKVFVLLLAMILVLSASMLVACGNGDTTEVPADDTNGAEAPADDAPAGDGVVLNFVTWWGGGGADMLRDNAAIFTANTGIEVDIETIAGGADYHTALITQFLAGTTPDIIKTQPDREFPALCPDGVLAALDDFMANDPNFDADRFFPGLLDTQKFTDGLTYSLPIHTDQIVMMYNKDLFEEAGVDIPPVIGWTWDDFFDALPQLAQFDDAGNIEVFAFYPEDYIPRWYMQTANIGLDDWTNPQVVDFVQRIADNMQYMASDGSVIDHFANGEMAIQILWMGQASGTVYALGDDIPFTVGLADMPQAVGLDRLVYSTTNGLSMASNSNFMDEAWKFIAYMASADGESDRGVDIVAPSGFGPAFDLFTTPNPDAFPFDFVGQLMARPGDRGLSIPMEPWVVPIFGELGAQWDPVLGGTMGGQEFAENMQRIAEEAIARER